MRRVNLILLVLGLAALGASDGHDVSDPCGDSEVYAEWEGERYEVPDPTVAPGFDIAGMSIDDAFEGDGAARRHVGVDVILQLCGDVPGPEAQGGGGAWAVQWSTGEDCVRRVLVDDAYYAAYPADAGVSRIFTFDELCLEDGAGGLYGVYETTSVVDVSAATTIAGDTITWRLRDADLGALTGAVTPGEVLVAPEAWVGAGVPGIASGSLPPPGGRFSLLFGDDSAGPGGDVTVGSDDS